MPPRICYLDACSVILLARADLLAPLMRSYRVSMAEDAYREVTVGMLPGAAELAGWQRQGAVQVLAAVPVADGLWSQRLAGLGAGERATLQLYLADRREGFVVTDDGKAARLCRDADIPFVNALLMAKLLGWAGGVSAAAAAAAAARLLEVGRYAGWVRAAAEQATPHQLAGFLPDAAVAPDAESARRRGEGDGSAEPSRVTSGIPG